MSAKAAVSPSGTWWWSMTIASMPRARGRRERLVVAGAAVAGDEHAAAVVGEAGDVVGAQAVARVAAGHARHDVAAERAQRAGQHGGRGDAVDVVVAEDADGLAAPPSAARQPVEARDARSAMPVGRPQIGQPRLEEARRQLRARRSRAPPGAARSAAGCASRPRAPPPSPRRSDGASQPSAHLERR